MHEERIALGYSLFQSIAKEDAHMTPRGRFDHDLLWRFALQREAGRGGQGLNEIIGYGFTLCVIFTQFVLHIFQHSY